MPDRARLLEAARAMDPVRPWVSFDRKLYVEPPNAGAHGWITRWIRRDPQARLVFIGGIGSGKTTELLKARKELEREELAHAWHLELDAYFDMASPREGMLVTLAGLAILASLERGGEPLHDAVLHPPTRLLHESLRPRRQRRDLVKPEHVSGGSPAPAKSATAVAQDMEPLVQRWRSSTKARKEIVLLVDAMDRRSRDDFLSMTREDVPILQKLGVGVIIVGNIDWRFDAEQKACFHEVWTQPFYDPSASQDAEFLRAVIEQRAPGLFTTPVARRIVQASGGVMRDLLTLALHTIYEAMEHAAYEVSPETTERAIAIFRDGTLANLNPSQRAALRALEQDGKMTDDSMGDALQARGCAILRDGVWEVHPAVRSPVSRHEAA